MKPATGIGMGALFTAIAVCGVYAPVIAQDKGKDTKVAPAASAGFTRNILQKGDTSAPGREYVQITAEFPPGVSTGRHSHPGEEVGYVLEGSFTFAIDGKPPFSLKTGDHFFVPANTVHEGKNTGAAKAKVLITYIVEKGRPLAIPVK